MLATMLDVEKPLLKGQMKAIDKLLEKGLKELSWSSSYEEKTAFIDEVMGLVTEAHVTLTAMKDNMRGIEAVLKKWADNPLITRKQTSKTYVPTVYTEEQAKELEVRYKDITDGGKEVHNLLLESNKVPRQSKALPLPLPLTPTLPLPLPLPLTPTLPLPLTLALALTLTLTLALTLTLPALTQVRRILAPTPTRVISHRRR